MGKRGFELDVGASRRPSSVVITDLAARCRESADAVNCQELARTLQPAALHVALRFGSP